MNEQEKRIYKRVFKIKKVGKAHICFESRYLLEGKNIALARDFEKTTYYGERITDYGQVPSPYIEIDYSVSSHSLEDLFKGKIDGMDSG